MSFVILISLMTQYTDVYIPHKPLEIESGALISASTAEFDFHYRTGFGDSLFSIPALSKVLFSPDGYNELGLELPLLWVDIDTVHSPFFGDSTHSIFLGNIALQYKRRIIGSIRYGYLAAKARAEFLTAQNTLNIRERLNNNRTLYGLGLSYTYELPLLKEYDDLFGKLPLVASVVLEDNFLYRENDTKEWGTDFSQGFSWGVSLDILPLDYAFVGASVQGTWQDLSVTPHIGFRWYWIDLAAAYRISSTPGLNLSLRFYL